MAVSERWSYQVVEVKPRFVGVRAADVQERLVQLGLQGWELVTVLQPHPLRAAQLILKKPM
jgi:hypothetical protein